MNQTQLVSLGIGLAVVLACFAAGAGECGSDMDCKGDRVCYEGTCVSPETAELYEEEERRRLVESSVADEGEEEEAEVVHAVTDAPDTSANAVDVGQEKPAVYQPVYEEEMTYREARLDVSLEEEFEGKVTVEVFVDGMKVGTAPWTGIVSAGVHEVRVDGPEYYSRSKKTMIYPKRTRFMKVKLIPKHEFDNGIFHLGVLYEMGVGVADFDGKARRSSLPGISPAVAFGFRLPSSGKGWWELGLIAGPYYTFKMSRTGVVSDDEYESVNEYELLYTYERFKTTTFPVGLLVRLLNPIKRPYVFWSLSLQPAVGIGGGHTRFVGAIRAGLSFFFGDHFELRVDPIGVQVLAGKFTAQSHAVFKAIDQEEIWSQRVDRYIDEDVTLTAYHYSPSIGFIARF